MKIVLQNTLMYTVIYSVLFFTAVLALHDQMKNVDNSTSKPDKPYSFFILSPSCDSVPKPVDCE